ncbi:MAG: VacB/RNase II family 3'-5' exoribonuclease [Deltaproteobacteria bacterium]|nr:VacB/RNase II family 3'-5' exoribonuclease [Deltaproteobacteria bacterium]
MDPGKILTYFDKGKITCGICLEKKGNRFHLLSEHNRELNLNPQRIIHSSEKTLNLKLSKEELLKTLKTVIGEEEQLKENVNTEELWNLLQGEEERFDLNYIAEMTFGANPTSEQSAAIFRALFEDKIHFKLKEGIFKAHTPHQVQQILMKIQRNAEREKDLEEGSYYQEGKQLLKRAHLTDPDAPFKLLVKMGELQDDENLLLPRYGIPTQWTNEALKEAEEIYHAFKSQPLSSKNKRRDLTSLKVFSIDSESTRDIDDALSIEAKGASYYVGIHIADVAHYILPESHLDREAYERTTSIYLPEGKIPMLPPALSEDALSLVEGEERLALSIIIHFDSSNEIKEYDIFPSTIKVHHRYSYIQSDNQIHRNQDFSYLLQLAQCLRKKRVNAGAIFLPIPELNIKVDEQKTTQVNKRERETPSEIIISELMILTNWLCASFLHEKGIPLIHRNQLDPKEMVEGAGKDNLFLNYKQRRLFNRVILSTTPDNHSSLGLKPYSTFTSPIRRYLDLTAQRQLKSALIEDRKPYSEEKLKQMIVDTEINQTKINLVHEQRHRYWLIKYLEDKVGKILPALVLNQLLNRCVLLLTDYLLEVSIPSSPADSLSPGTTIEIKLESADAQKGTIRVIPA